MEYVDLINHILSAERNAGAIAQEAKDRQANLEQDLEQETQSLHDRYMERARRRVSIVEDTEAKAAQESIAALDKRFTRATAQMDRAYENCRAQWVDALFTRITGEEL